MAPKIKKRGSIVADAKEMLASPQVTPTKKSVDDGELKQLKRTSLVKTSSFKSGEIANLVNSPTPPKSPITDDEAEALSKAKEEREKNTKKEKLEKHVEEKIRRQSRATEAEKEVSQGKREKQASIVTRRSSSFETGEIAKLTLSPPKSPPITNDEVAVITKAKGEREKNIKKKKIEDHVETLARRQSRASEAEKEVAQGKLDVKKEVKRRSSAAFSPESTEKAFIRQREISAFAQALKRDSLIEDNLHGEQYKARKGELVAAHEEYNKAMKDKEEKGILPSDEDVYSLDGAIKVKGKGEGVATIIERKESTNEKAADGEQPDWQKKGWQSDRPAAAGKSGYLLKKGGSKRTDKGRAVKLFTRHNWNTRFFMLNTTTKQLHYFKDEVSPEPLGTFELGECTVQRIGHHVHTFVLELNGPCRKGFLLAAANTKELDEWERAIASFCKTL